MKKVSAILIVICALASQQASAVYNATATQLMSARLTQTPIRVWSYDDQLWPLSTGQFCRIDAIDLDM